MKKNEIVLTTTVVCATVVASLLKIKNVRRQCDALREEILHIGIASGIVEERLDNGYYGESPDIERVMNDFAFERIIPRD